MKKGFITLILLLVMISNVNGMENYGDVFGKYQYNDNTNFYREQMMPNNKVNVITDDININVQASNYLDNVDIVLVESSNELLHFEDIADDAIIYYVDFYDNNIRHNLNGKVTISSVNNSDFYNSIISFYDSNGSLDKEINSINNGFSLDITHSGYLVIEKDILNKIVINSSYGSIAIDGILYNDVYYTKKGNISIIVVPNNDYKTSNIVFNGHSLELNGGFIDLLLDKTNTLNITYVNDTYDEVKTFNLTGNLYKNGVPLSGAKVVLHSNEKVLYTDRNGHFAFTDVEYGFHTLSIYDDSELTGYQEFEVASANVTRVVYVDDDIDQIKIAKNTVEVMMNIAMNDDYTLELSNFSNYRLGDVNLDTLVNINDLITMRKYLVNLVSLSDVALRLADLKPDNKVNINDIVKMRKYLAGLEEL